MTNKKKIWQIEIDENPPNPRVTEKENRSAAVEIGYNVLVFLFWVLVASKPYFRLAALIGLLWVQAIRDAVLTRKEVVVDLSDYFYRRHWVAFGGIILSM